MLARIFKLSQLFHQTGSIQELSRPTCLVDPWSKPSSSLCQCSCESCQFLRSSRCPGTRKVLGAFLEAAPSLANSCRVAPPAFAALARLEALKLHVQKYCTGLCTKLTNTSCSHPVVMCFPADLFLRPSQDLFQTTPLRLCQRRKNEEFSGGISRQNLQIHRSPAVLMMRP